ncbi:MAG: hypothetical protein K6T83_08495 [Alicyclobacillus sp.]|nr:hypothetical protein [Alicyclobacillus sp.]
MIQIQNLISSRIAAIGAVALMTAGCGILNSTTAKQVQLASTSKRVQLASLPSSEQQAILKVAKHFGDPNPKVVKITQDVTDPDHKLMYLVRLRGHFYEGKVQSNDLSFSILGDASIAWAITNQSGAFKVLTFHSSDSLYNVYLGGSL